MVDPIEFRLLNERAKKNIVVRQPTIKVEKPKYEIYERPEDASYFRDNYVEIAKENHNDRYRPTTKIVEEIFEMTNKNVEKESEIVTNKFRKTFIKNQFNMRPGISQTKV